MQIKKIVLDEINRCYSVGTVQAGGEVYLIFASEAVDGPCYSYSGKGFCCKEVVWERGGGTMSLVPIPHREGEFLATQNFFPGFNAGSSKIVWVKRTASGWHVEDFISVPYLHRFDILRKNGVNYFIGATLCRSKKEREDWSDPGDIYTGILPDLPSEKMHLQILKSGLVKNHGYWRGGTESKPIAYIASENGIHALGPPEKDGGEWSLKQLTRLPASDLAVFDLDGDGQDEFVVLHPFHGDSYDVMKLNLQSGRFETLYSYPFSPVFSHVAWAGVLNGKPVAIGGYRREKAELFLLQYNPVTKQYDAQVLDTGFGPSNASVVEVNGITYIAVANNLMHQAAIYQISNE